MDARELEAVVGRLRSARTDSQDVEVKEAVGKLPGDVVETLSAFSNGTGGTIVLGLSERDGFAPAKGFDARRIADALAQACSDRLTPPVRAGIEIVELGGAQVVVATVGGIAPRDKPCYVTARGMYGGSFIRAFDGDRRLSPYEIDRLLEDRTQPAHDAGIVGDAVASDLDADLLAGLVRRQKALHPRLFASCSDEEAAVELRALARDADGTLRPTLAGLLALGTHPQRYFPRLTVTFAAYPGEGKEPEGGVKFLDSAKMAGPIPAVIADTVAAVQRNTRLGGVMDGAMRVDAPDYPPAAVREAVCNALMHRDYSELARGTQVQVNLYSDRLEFLSPGGLFGTVTADNVGTAGYSSTRNQHLADILESTPYEGGFVAENRGTGFRLMERELAAAGMPAPEVRDSISMFSLTFRRPQGVSRAAAGDAVLAFIAASGPCAAADIAAALGMPRSTVTYRLRRLIDEGSVRRTGPEGGRTPLYSLA
ncbi:MAG: ATP-binding protein [Coriobacteriales bacterium]